MRRLTTVLTLAAALGLSASGRPALAAAARPGIIARIPASSRLVVYISSLRAIDVASANDAGFSSPNPQGENWEHTIASMGLAQSIDSRGSILLVIPGNNIGVALPNAPRVIILPILHRKNFLKATDAKPMKPAGVFRGINHHYIFVPRHAKSFVFQFRGRHAICAEAAETVLSFGKARRWLKPSQVSGAKGGRSVLVAARINVMQEAFEIRAGITAMIGATQPSAKARAWQYFIDRFINDTSALGLAMSQRDRAIHIRLHVTPKAKSRLAALIAAQGTVSPEAIVRFPLRHYVLAAAQAIDWGAINQYAAPASGKAGEGMPSKGRTVVAKPLLFPRVFNQITSTVLVVAEQPENRGIGATLMAKTDARIPLVSLERDAKTVASILTGWGLPEARFGPIMDGRIPVEIKRGKQRPEAYQIAPVEPNSLLFAPTSSFPAMRRRVLAHPPVKSPTGEKLLRGARQYVPSHLIAVVFVSAGPADTGETGDAGNGSSSSALIPPAIATISRSGSRLELACHVPIQSGWLFGPLGGLLFP